MGVSINCVMRIKIVSHILSLAGGENASGSLLERETLGQCKWRDFISHASKIEDLCSATLKLRNHVLLLA